MYIYVPFPPGFHSKKGDSLEQRLLPRGNLRKDLSLRETRQSRVSFHQGDSLVSLESEIRHRRVSFLSGRLAIAEFLLHQECSLPVHQGDQLKQSFLSARETCTSGRVAVFSRFLSVRDTSQSRVSFPSGRLAVSKFPFPGIRVCSRVSRTCGC